MKRYLRKIYEIIPFKLPVYKVIRKFIRLPHNFHQYLYFKGIFSTKVNGSFFLMKNYGYQFHVENEYFWGGINNGWEKESTRLWLQLCRDTKLILDIGANTGCFSLIAKTINPDVEIHAFEPLNGVIKKLKLNIELNKFPIHAHQFALSNFNGTAKVYPTSLDHVYSVTVNKNLFEGVKVFEETIYTKRLDDFIRENNLSKIDLMKIDVETHEVEVLEGMGKYLREMKPNMLIEIQTDEIANGIEKLIDGLDYLYFNINEEKGIRQVQKLGKSDWLNYLICDPQTARKLNLIRN